MIVSSVGSSDFVTGFRIGIKIKMQEAVKKIAPQNPMFSLTYFFTSFQPHLAATNAGVSGQYQSMAMSIH
jgi:hypothetical protein